MLIYEICKAESWDQMRSESQKSNCFQAYSKLFPQVPRSLKYAVARADATDSYYWPILDASPKTQKYRVMIEFV